MVVASKDPRGRWNDPGAWTALTGAPPMDQPTEPPPRSEDAGHQPCPCGDPNHEPTLIGHSFSSSGPGLALYGCPETTSYRLGQAS